MALVEAAVCPTHAGGPEATEQYTEFWLGGFPSAAHPLPRQKPALCRAQGGSVVRAR